MVFWLMDRVHETVLQCFLGVEHASGQRVPGRWFPGSSLMRHMAPAAGEAGRLLVDKAHLVVATRKSAAQASSAPPPSAKPSIAAMTGMGALIRVKICELTPRRAS